MIKPKRKRPSDTVQLAHSVFADVIKLSGKAVKVPKSLRKKRKSG
jgi:hypothetical protein